MGMFGKMLSGMGESAMNSVGGMAGGLVGGLLGKIGAKKRARQQLDMQMKLNDAANKSNYEWGEKSAANAFDRQMQLYERTYQDESFANKRKQMEEAGLNVGLMYGGGGASGGGAGSTSSVAQGGAGGAQAGQASSETDRQMAMQQQTALSLQAAKLQSEIELNKANANKLNADAGKQPTEIEEMGANIASKMQDVENKKIQAEGQKLDNELKKMEVTVNTYTMGGRIDGILAAADSAKHKANILLEQLDQEKVNTEVKQKTKQDVIRSYNMQIQQAAAEILVKQSQEKLNNEQANKLIEEITDLMDQREAGGKNWEIAREEMNNKLYAAGINAGTAFVGELIGVLSKRFPGKGITGGKKSGKVY